MNPLVGSVLDNSSFMGANDIFGKVPPEWIMLLVVYRSEVLISVFPARLSENEKSPPGAESRLMDLEELINSRVGVTDRNMSLGVAERWV